MRVEWVGVILIVLFVVMVLASLTDWLLDGHMPWP